MQKVQPRNTRNMKKKGNVTLTKVHNSSTTESKDTKLGKMPDKEFKSLIFKINDLQ
jgi:hypothetical protein